MKIYLAAPFTDRAKLPMLRLDDKLTMLGHTLTSTWYHRDHDLETAAALCLDEVHAADTFIIDTTLGTSTGGGMWGELGYALALDKWCLGICRDPSAHVFLTLSRVWVGPDHEWLLGILHNYGTVEA